MKHIYYLIIFITTLSLAISCKKDEGVKKEALTINVDKIETDSVLLSWSKVNGRNYFLIFVSENEINPDSESAYKTVKENNSVIIDNLLANTEYNIFIEGYGNDLNTAVLADGAIKVKTEAVTKELIGNWENQENNNEYYIFNANGTGLYRNTALNEENLTWKVKGDYLVLTSSKTLSELTGIYPVSIETNQVTIDSLVFIKAL